ncbi:MAG: histidine decarboxylase, pyruvoyl type [Eggerthella lenta]
MWSFIAISLSADRDFAADLFIEDAGVWTENDNEEDMIAFLEQHRKAIVWSVVECAATRTCCSTAPTWASLTADEAGRDRQRHHGGPYVTLARNAVPATGFASLNNLHLSDWLKQMDFEPLTDIA